MHDAPTRSTRRLDLFLPAATAAAWLLVATVHLHSPHPVPPEARFDCFADPCQVRWTLGDGWHWVS
ncbi:hypothetical protein [Micromonospora sp. SH-82]|uniref:hypothetical protein n=1 Tax=Micromonospora sp. SH-82 TaxID=3132938 RepID=UPI003EB8A593